jgi:hypothetical protein
MMKKIKNYFTAMVVVAGSFFAVSCDDNEDLVVDPNIDYDVELAVSQGGGTPNEDVIVDANTASTIDARVTFTSTSVDMKRLYITRNVSGAGEVKFEPSENVDLKGDGSVDLTGKDSKNLDFGFELPVPAGIGNGTVVYKFWTTTGNGDFRDISQRLAVGPGTITIRYGSGSNPAADVKSYSDVKLFAPTADGASKTFVSLSDGKTYNVSQGIEFVSLWDFGYLYSVTADAATLRSPYNYPTIAIDIPTKASTTNSELNRTHFKESTKTTGEFDAVSKSADLNFVTVTSTDATLVITQLAANDVIEFVDEYGKKGLIKVLQVSGTNGSDGFIRVAIKVQP